MQNKLPSDASDTESMTQLDEVDVATQEVPGSQTPPHVEKSVLIKKLQDVPADLLRSILTNQVDLEIRLKHKELKLTEEEIGKCEAQMLALRKFLEVPNEVSFRHEPNDFTLKYFDILNKSLSVNYTKLQQRQYAQEHPVFKETMFAQAEPSTHSYRTRSTTSSLRPSIGGPAVRIAGCLYRRTDGVVVKLTCYDCLRSNFSSAQGFLNHNRIAHSREYASQDSAALQCGEVLPNEFQDEEGLASLTALNTQNLEPSKNLNPKDGYFGLSRPSHKGQILAETCSNSQTSNKPATRRSTPDSGRNSRAQSEEVKAVLRDSIPDGAGSEELMKKLISSGLARDVQDFNNLIGEVQKEVVNSHLFADEEEMEGVEEDKVALLSSDHDVVESGQRDSVHTENKAQKSSKEEDINSSAGESAQPPKSETSKPSERAESGGKYENRLRRRKSRAGVSLTGIVDHDDYKSRISEGEDRKTKRRRSHK